MAVLWLLGCGSGSSPWWMDALAPESPCFRVNLVDGLEAASTAEWHDLFACVDQNDLIAPLRPLDRALDVQTRGGATVGAELSAAVDRLLRTDVDPFALVGVAADAVVSADFGPWLDLGLELAYGVPADDVWRGAIDLGDPERLAGGVLAPLAPVVPAVAGALLDDDLGAASFAGERLVDPRTDRWVRTIASTVGSDDPAIAQPLRPVARDLSRAVLAARSPADDRWPGASGDSLRDVVDFFVVQENPVVDRISPAVAAVLDDAGVRAALVPTIDALQAQGHVAPLGEQLAWLASVGLDGEALEPGEPSALYRFVRLLAVNNHPVDCSIDLVFTSIDWQFDNLAVAALETVANLEPGRVEDLAGIVGDLTGGGLTLDLLELGVDTGVCPSLTTQTLEDLSAMSVLTEPEATDLLATFVAVLEVAQDGDEDHLPDLADAATELFDAGAIEPGEELIRDWADSALSADLAAAVPALIHPEDHGITAAGGPPASLDDLLDAVGWVFTPDGTGRTGAQRLRPLAATLLREDGAWQAIGALATVGADERSTTSELPSLLPALLEMDPDLVVLHEVGPLLGDPELAGPLLRVAERDEVTGALLAASAATYGMPDTGEVPLGGFGKRVIDGTLARVLALVHTVVTGLGGGGAR